MRIIQFQTEEYFEEDFFVENVLPGLGTDSEVNTVADSEDLETDATSEPIALRDAGTQTEPPVLIDVGTQTEPVVLAEPEPLPEPEPEPAPEPAPEVAERKRRRSPRLVAKEEEEAKAKRRRSERLANKQN